MSEGEAARVRELEKVAAKWTAFVNAHAMLVKEMPPGYAAKLVMSARGWEFGMVTPRGEVALNIDEGKISDAVVAFLTAAVQASKDHASRCAASA